MQQMFDHWYMSRKCVLVDGKWRVFNPDQQLITLEVCGMDHPMHLTSEVREVSDDRGDFGMPGVGVGRVLPMPEKRNDALFSIEVNRGSLSFNYGDEGEDVDLATEEAERIVHSLPSWLGRFLRKNQKYARAQNIDLGAKGIMPDINRKTSVLLDRIWFGAGEVDESTVEVIDDLLGHLMLLRDKLTDDEDS